MKLIQVKPQQVQISLLCEGFLFKCWPCSVRKLPGSLPYAVIPQWHWTFFLNWAIAALVHWTTQTSYGKPSYVNIRCIYNTRIPFFSRGFFFFRPGCLFSIHYMKSPFATAAKYGVVLLATELATVICHRHLFVSVMFPQERCMQLKHCQSGAFHASLSLTSNYANSENYSFFFSQKEIIIIELLGLIN